MTKEQERLISFLLKKSSLLDDITIFFGLVDIRFSSGGGILNPTCQRRARERGKWGE